MTDLEGFDSGARNGSMPVERLPFTVSVVTSDRDLAAAVGVRSSAYMRHNAPAADRLLTAEKEDTHPEAVVLLVRAHGDGAAIGSLRLNPNVARPMCFEQSTRIHVAGAGRPSVELMRLAVSSGPSGRLVTNALAKAAYLICIAQNIQYAYVAARRPLDSVYKRFMFSDMLDGARVDLAYAPGVPHSIMYLELEKAAALWDSTSKGVYTFFLGTQHPDIQLDMTEVGLRFGNGRSAE